MGDGAPGPGVAGGKTKEQHRAAKAKLAATAASLATSDRKTKEAKEKANQRGTGNRKVSFDPDEATSYKQIGSVLAEAFGLVEKLLHTMGDKEKQEMGRKFRLDQRGKAPQNRVRAARSAAQNATLDKELDTQIVQSGGDRKVKV